MASTFDGRGLERSSETIDVTQSRAPLSAEHRKFLDALLSQLQVSVDSGEPFDVVSLINLLTRHDNFNVESWNLTRNSAKYLMNSVQEFLDTNLESAVAEQDRQSNTALRLLHDLSSCFNDLPSRYILNKISISREIAGSGGEAVVLKGSYGKTPVAVRILKDVNGVVWNSKAGHRTLTAIRREIITHYQLNHENILCLLGVIDATTEDGSPSPPMMILPFVPLKAKPYLQQDRTLRSFLKTVCDILHGVLYLHSCSPPVIHGDLHPDNVLITSDGTAKLCDFGLTRIRYEITRTLTQIRSGGKLRFIAPELTLSDDKFRTTEASDIYSLAMLLYELSYETIPFHNIANEFKVVTTAQSGVRPKRRPLSSDRVPFNDWVHAEQPLWSLLETMWVPELDRPGIALVHSKICDLVPTCSELDPSSSSRMQQRAIFLTSAKEESSEEDLPDLSPPYTRNLAKLPGALNNVPLVIQTSHLSSKLLTSQPSSIFDDDTSTKSEFAPDWHSDRRIVNSTIIPTIASDKAPSLPSYSPSIMLPTPDSAKSEYREAETIPRPRLTHLSKVDDTVLPMQTSNVFRSPLLSQYFPMRVQSAPVFKKSEYSEGQAYPRQSHSQRADNAFEYFPRAGPITTDPIGPGYTTPPPAFARSPHPQLHYSPFKLFHVFPDMNDVYSGLPDFPPLPPVLIDHDVTADDWAQWMTDLITAWVELCGPRGENSAPGASATHDIRLLVDTWNRNFFLRRAVFFRFLKKGVGRRGSRSLSLSLLRSTSRSVSRRREHQIPQSNEDGFSDCESESLSEDEDNWDRDNSKSRDHSRGRREIDGSNVGSQRRGRGRASNIYRLRCECLIPNSPGAASAPRNSRGADRSLERFRAR